MGVCRSIASSGGSRRLPAAVVSAARSAARRHFHATAAAHKIVHFNLPDIGEGIAEVEVLGWSVKVGDRVAQFDKLVEVQSDKATVDITSRYDGVVKKIYYDVGQMAPTGMPLVDIEVEGGDDAGDAAAPTAAATATQPAAGAGACPLGGGASDAAVPEGDVRALATPAVRRIAKENNVDVSKVRGTGKDGRVTKEDILKHVESKGASSVAPAAPPAKASKPAPASEPTAPAAAPAKPVVFTSLAEDKKVPIRGLQRAMVKSMSAAWQVPHFGYCDEVCMDQLSAVRSALKPIAEARGLKFSYLPLILKATSLALHAFPELNATVNADVSEVTQRAAHNIGVAMDTPRGLIVPNVKHCEQRTVLEIAQELARLQALGAAGKLSEEDLTGGTFTLSNIGTVGGTYASPVIFTPQVAIGAIGKIVKVPRYASTLPAGHPRQAGKKDADDVVPTNIMTVSWAADHRVLDGASMARFSNLWKQYLEQPTTMLAQLK